MGQIMVLAPDRQQANIWTDDGLIYWHKYVLFSLSEFNSLRPSDAYMRW